MFALGTSQRYYLCRSFCDMRKSFDGLCGLVITDLKREPHNGDVYIFINKSRDKIKLLQWQPGGFVLYYKRLESGRFFKEKEGESSGAITLDYHQLVMLIEGIQFKEIKRQKRYKNVLKKHVKSQCFPTLAHDGSPRITSPKRCVFTCFRML